MKGDRMETAELQHNVEKAIQFDNAKGNGKASILLNADDLEIEVFLRLKGSNSTPALLGIYKASEIDIGSESEE